MTLCRRVLLKPECLEVKWLPGEVGLVFTLPVLGVFRPEKGWKGARVSTPVSKAFQGLPEGCGGILPSHCVLVVAEGHAFNCANLFGCLGPVGPVPSRFSRRRRAAPAEAVVATKDTA